MAKFTPAAAEAMSGKTRATLLERLHEGSDPLAWEEFYQRYWPLVYASAKRRGCSDHTAEEIVQEVMLTVFEQKDADGAPYRTPCTIEDLRPRVHHVQFRHDEWDTPLDAGQQDFARERRIVKHWDPQP